MDRRLFLSLIAGTAAWPTMARAVPRPPGAPRRLRLVNAHTGETFEGRYRNDKGTVRNWTLEARGLDSLLVFDGRRLKIDGQGQVVLGGPWQPLTVPQRLVLQRQLARAEFLARSTGNLRIRP